MPYPDNLKFAYKAETICRSIGVVPATICVINGKICVGTTAEQLGFISINKKVNKISRRDLGVAVAKNWSGGTTVSATMQISNSLGIKVFSTGGIGGVHRGFNKTIDVSQDILALKETPIVVVSSGAKAILDIKKTVEALETNGVVVLGYGIKTFSAFYSRETGFPIQKVNSVKTIISVFKNHLSFGCNSSVLISNPIPKKTQIVPSEIKTKIKAALKKARFLKISGKDLTPFLLNELFVSTKGQTLAANKSLAINNVKLGAKIALGLSA